MKLWLLQSFRKSLMDDPSGKETAALLRKCTCDSRRCEAWKLELQQELVQALAKLDELQRQKRWQKLRKKCSFLKQEEAACYTDLRCFQ